MDQLLHPYMTTRKTITLTVWIFVYKVMSLLFNMLSGFVMCVHARLFQSCLTLCYFMDCSLPGSSVHGILQARIQEWVTMPSSRGSFWPRDRTCVSCLLHWQMGSLPLAPHEDSVFLVLVRDTVKERAVDE